VIAAQCATALAEHGAVAFSSLEMSAVELVQRFVSERAMVNMRHLKNNRMTDEDFARFRSRREVLAKLNIAIDDRTSISPADVRGFVRGLSKKHTVSGVVVDYLQLMSSPSRSERYQQVTEFSREMKIIAKDFNVPVIVLSQLNRQSESRSDGRPKISDLRESGAIEQDADVVMLLRREGEVPKESLFIDVAKNRHGETGEVELDWQGAYSRAVELG
jgi:replicative DNA helicase